MDGYVLTVCLLIIGCGHTVFYKPFKVVAHTGLSRFISIEAGKNPILHHAADAGNHLLLPAAHNAAGGGSHDHQELVWLCDPHRGKGYVGIHIGHSNCHARTQPQAVCCLISQFPGFCSLGTDFSAKFFLCHMFQTCIKSFEKIRGWVTFPLIPKSLVSGRTSAALLLTRQLKNHPVRSLHKPVCLFIDFRSLFQDLHQFWNHPFGRNSPPVS